MRNLKVLGSALLAILAVSVAMAAAASGDELTAEKYPALITGKNLAENDQFLTTTGTVNCKTAAYIAIASGSTTSVSVTPGYLNCTAFGFPGVVEVNGCKYVFNIAGGSGTTGDADLVCEIGKSITITAISAGTIKCTVHVGSQSDITGTVTYSNRGAGATREVVANSSLSGIDYTHTTGTGLGACPAGSATNGTLSASGVGTGEVSPSGGHIGIFLS